jgi:hypothetical protein
MRWPRWLFRCGPEECSEPPERVDTVETDDGHREALDAQARARAAKLRAEKRLLYSKAQAATVRRELAVNHLAQDIYDAMRRKK